MGGVVSSLGDGSVSSMAARGTRSTGSTQGRRGRPRAGSGDDRPNLWPRRILTTGALVLVVVLLIGGIWQIVRVIAGSSSPSGAQPGAASPSSSSTSSAATIVDCNASNLTIQTTVDGKSGAVGSGAKFSVVVSHAAGQPDCSTAAGQIAIKVSSGDESIYESSACTEASPSATPLLFSGDESWTGSLSWDGGMYQGCTPIESNGKTKVAHSGTYRVQTFLGEDPIGQEISFDVK